MLIKDNAEIKAHFKGFVNMHIAHENICTYNTKRIHNLTILANSIGLYSNAVD